MTTIIAGDFEWDEAKAASNLAKHGVSFDEAANALRDPRALDIDDLGDPGRVVTLALSPRTGMLFVVWTEGTAHRTRIISARKATSHEQRTYQED